MRSQEKGSCPSLIRAKPLASAIDKSEEELGEGRTLVGCGLNVVPRKVEEERPLEE